MMSVLAGAWLRVLDQDFPAAAMRYAATGVGFNQSFSWLGIVELMFGDRGALLADPARGEVHR